MGLMDFLKNTFTSVKQSVNFSAIIDAAHKEYNSTSDQHHWWWVKAK
jgi:hypothetical protein